MPNVNLLQAIVNLGDQAIVITFNIEHRTNSHQISVRIIGFHISEIRPVSFRCSTIPTVQRRNSIEVFFSKLSDRFSAYYSHDDYVLALRTRNQVRVDLAGRTNRSSKNLCFRESFVVCSKPILKTNPASITS